MQSLWMLLAGFMFSLMGVFVKLASVTYTISEIVMSRGAIGIIIILVISKFQNLSLKTNFPLHHVSRGIIGVIAMWLWFYSISILPLATAMTINYMSPIWIASFIFFSSNTNYSKKMLYGLTISILCSFFGVAFLLKPSIQSEQFFGGLIALISSFLTAIAYIKISKLGKLGEPEFRVVFYFSLICFFFGIAGSFVENQAYGKNYFFEKKITFNDLIFILCIGLSATIGQITLTKAYHYGSMLLTANLQYSGIIFSSLWGILIWKDTLNILSWFGISIILLSGLGATFFRYLLTKNTNSNNFN